MIRIITESNMQYNQFDLAYPHYDTVRMKANAEQSMIRMTLPRWAALVGLPQEKDGGDDGPGGGDVGGEPRPRHQQQAAQHQEEVKHLVAHPLYYLLRAFRHSFHW